MSTTLLYSVFHLNLAFSSIEREDYSLVVKRCYYPILDLIEHGQPVAIEATAQTLMEIEKVDKGFCTRLRGLIEEGKTEFIASGFSQIVMPLAPEVVNRWNLKLGGDYYEKLLGVRPKVALVPEQTFSTGIVDIYKDCGIDAIIMDWSNSYQYNKYPKDYLFYPQSAIGESSEVTLLWSHSISFQKFQRYAHGELTLEEYKEFLLEQTGGSGNGRHTKAFPLYINDAEVFAYRPGTSGLALKSFSETEWGRISVLLAELNATEGFELALPGNVIKETATGSNSSACNRVKLTSAQTALPCKKQKKYNPTRWAVTGRDSVHINTECFAALKRIVALEGKLQDSELAVFKEKLCLLWGSDYRTNTTDEKLEEYRFLMGWLMVETKSVIDRLALDDSVSAPEKNSNASGESAAIEESERVIKVKTEEVTVELLKDKGLAIKSLVMPTLSEKPVIITLAHGFYDDIHYGADYFSGHLINVEKDGTKVCDLVKVDSIVEEFADRVTVSAKIALKFGQLLKSYEIYKSEPRLSLTYKLKVSALEASSLRLGIFTLNPELFEKKSLYFEAASGSVTPERFLTGEESFDHGEPVNPTVSATSCIGATTGEIQVGDKFRALSIKSDKAELYSVPLVKFSPVDDSFFFRVSHSVGERDETAYWTWRGLNTISFTITPVKSEKRSK